MKSIRILLVALILLCGIGLGVLSVLGFSLFSGKELLQTDDSRPERWVRVREAAYATNGQTNIAVIEVRSGWRGSAVFRSLDLLTRRPSDGLTQTLFLLRFPDSSRAAAFTSPLGWQGFASLRRPTGDLSRPWRVGGILWQSDRSTTPRLSACLDLEPEANRGIPRAVVQVHATDLELDVDAVRETVAALRAMEPSLLHWKL